MGHLKKIIFHFVIFLAVCAKAQGPYEYTLTKTKEGCARANVELAVSGQQPADTMHVKWSTGASNTFHQANLDEGFYSVTVQIRHKKDTTINTKDTTLIFLKDTTIQFAILRQECAISVETYFSPNGDNYNDVLGISNIDFYPNFELNIYNRWGQRVHHQQSKYTPWDGTALGLDVPDGPYYYVIFYDLSDHIHLVKGDFTILR